MSNEIAVATLNNILRTIRAGLKSGWTFADTFEFFHICTNFARTSSDATAEDVSYGVLLHAYEQQRKILVIKALREMTGMGLKDAKELVESSPPVKIVDGLTYQDARTAQHALSNAGATATVDKMTVTRTDVSADR